LNILVEHIEDRADMEHRFLVVGRQEPLPSGRDQTSLMFSVRDRPGFLYRALGIFAHQEINLTRIESRPSKRRAWDYLFYVDFEGHQTDAVVKAALGDLSNLPGVTAKILGSYPRPAL
jgi:chorismate mutase/prephenate dehydratase